MANCSRYSLSTYVYGHAGTLLAVFIVEQIVNGLQVLVVNTLDMYPIWPTVTVTLKYLCLRTYRYQYSVSCDYC